MFDEKDTGGCIDVEKCVWVILSMCKDDEDEVGDAEDVVGNPVQRLTACKTAVRGDGWTRSLTGPRCGGSRRRCS